MKSGIRSSAFIGNLPFVGSGALTSIAHQIGSDEFKLNWYESLINKDNSYDSNYLDRYYTSELYQNEYSSLYKNLLFNFSPDKAFLTKDDCSDFHLSTKYLNRLEKINEDYYKNRLYEPNEGNFDSIYPLKGQVDPYDIYLYSHEAVHPDNSYHLNSFDLTLNYANNLDYYSGLNRRSYFSDYLKRIYKQFKKSNKKARKKSAANNFIYTQSVYSEIRVENKVVKLRKRICRAVALLLRMIADSLVDLRKKLFKFLGDFHFTNNIDDEDKAFTATCDLHLFFNYKSSSKWNTKQNLSMI